MSGSAAAWASKGSWARLGLQQTPYIDYMEGIYRYRFQGPIFSDAEKFMTSSDFGVSTHYNFPNNHVKSAYDNQVQKLILEFLS